MTDLTNLPADTTAEDFFYEILPEVLSEVDLPDGLGSERMQFNVLGEGGVEVNIGIEDGEVSLEEGQADAPPIAVSVSEDDFLSLVCGDLRDKIKEVQPNAKIGPRQLRRSFMPDSIVQQLKALSGDIQLRIADPETGTEIVITNTIGGGTPNLASPSCVVKVNVPTLLDIASGRENPQQLFMQGRIMIDGDMGIVMQMMGIMQSR